jgi:hypothetical protein
MVQPANSWRRLSTAFPNYGIVDAAAGVLGGYLVVAGGRLDPTNIDTAVGTVRYLAQPSPTLLSPTWATSPNGLHTPRSASAYAVANGRLYVIGGIANGDCLSTSEYATSATGAWDYTTTPKLPDADADLHPDTLCQGTAVAIGTKIYVTGGLALHYLNAGSPGPVGNLSGAPVTYVLDTVSNTWTYDVANVDPSVERFSTAGASDGSTAVVVGGIETYGAMELAPPTASVVTLTVGPSFASVGSLPVAVGRGAAAYVSGSFYHYGGSSVTPNDSDSSGVDALYKAAVSSPGAWSVVTPSGTAPAARSGHVFCRFTWTDGSEHLYAVGGQSGGLRTSAVDEFTP